MSKLIYKTKININNDRKELTIPPLVTKYNVRHKIVEYLTRKVLSKNEPSFSKSKSNLKYIF